MHYKHGMVGQLDVHMEMIPSNMSTNMCIIQAVGLEHASAIVVRKPVENSRTGITYYIERDTKIRDTRYDYLTVREDAVRSTFFQHGSTRVDYTMEQNCVRINFSQVRKFRIFLKPYHYLHFCKQ